MHNQKEEKIKFDLIKVSCYDSLNYIKMEKI